LGSYVIFAIFNVNLFSVNKINRCIYAFSTVPGIFQYRNPNLWACKFLHLQAWNDGAASGHDIPKVVPMDFPVSLGLVYHRAGVGKGLDFAREHIFYICGFILARLDGVFPHGRIGN
jgi:hypothetical protein